jgi:hypothetical protein
VPIVTAIAGVSYLWKNVGGGNSAFNNQVQVDSVDTVDVSGCSNTVI